MATEFSGSGLLPKVAEHYVVSQTVSVPRGVCFLDNNCEHTTQEIQASETGKKEAMDLMVGIPPAPMYVDATHGWHSPVRIKRLQIFSESHLQRVHHYFLVNKYLLPTGNLNILVFQLSRKLI